MAVKVREMVKAQNWLEEKIVWAKSTDPEYPFSAESGGKNCTVRLNDFPDQSLYTLLVNGEEAADFDDWPQQWVRPAYSGLQLSAPSVSVPRPVGSVLGGHAPYRSRY